MSNMQELEKIIDVAENLGWCVREEEDNRLNLSQFSSAGQDFNINIESGNDAKTFIQNLIEYAENFDVSYETYLWLDEWGHGGYGAPYDMKDVYEDMEECLKITEDLIDELEKIDFDEEGITYVNMEEGI